MRTEQIAIIGMTLVALCSSTWNAHGQDMDSLTLTVVVSGAAEGSGQAIGSLFDSKDSYLKAPAQEAIVAIDSTGRATLVFDGLTEGVYAVSVIYDEDSDGKLDTGFLGIPTEPVAMSNNARGRFGPPGFEKVRFDMRSTMTIEISFAKARE